MAKIAIIGSGISGLGAAYLLHTKHEITVYEKNAEIGGHTRTRTARVEGKDVPVDTGFIVFNYRNYPNLSAVFKHLDVPVAKSNMSFGVSAAKADLEWSAQSPDSLFGQRRNLLRPAFYRFLLDIARFNTGAAKKAKGRTGLTLGGLIQEMGLGEWFAKYYILPMGGAIWSCDLNTILGFPAITFTEFFEAHGLLTVTDQPQWHTVIGGSREYLSRLTAPFKDRIRTGSFAVKVTRERGKVQVTDAQGQMQEYDHVILACHGNEALAVLGDAGLEERETLTAFTYQKNTAVLHKDPSFMPRRKKCWASWVYLADQREDAITVTYWMNQLQPLATGVPLFVTLNPHKEIAPEHVFDTHVFEHPVYSLAAIAAQEKIKALQGKQNTWFAGAHLRYGFHEDGFTSGINVAKMLGAEVPW